METQGTRKHRVVIVGGGVAALEAALALRHLAPESTARTVVAPNEEYVVRAQTVREPFELPAADHFPLAPIVRGAGATLVAGALESVDPEAKTVTTTEGVLPYDSLVLALGARAHARYEHAITVDHRSMASVLQGLLTDIDAAAIRSVAFITPTGPAWPLPLYELAYLTARRAREHGSLLSTTLITPEDRPMMLFGMTASNAVTRLLHDGGVEVVSSSEAEVPTPHQVVVNPGMRHLQVDRVVALPELVGPAIPGLEHDEHGFLPVDDHGRVAGAAGVYAAGDASSHEIKHGGFSAQQADAVAETIASIAGEAIEPQPLAGLLRGMFITGDAPRYLSAHHRGGHAYDSVFTTEPTMEPGSKIAARYLSEYLAQAA